MKAFDWGGKLCFIGLIFWIFFAHCMNLAIEMKASSLVIGSYAALTIGFFACFVTGVIRIIWNEGINKRKG